MATSIKGCLQGYIFILRDNKFYRQLWVKITLFEFHHSSF